MAKTTDEGGNLAAVLYKQHDLRIERRPIPEPGDNEVQIRMRCVGVCGSDIHLWDHGRIGDDISVTEPFVQGHECSGVISKVGANVTTLQQGDRVAIEPMRVRRRCEACMAGRYNLCENIFFFSKPADDGALSQYIVHDPQFVYKLCEGMSLEEGALVEPLSVGLYACRRAKLAPGDTLLITGAGAIGLCTLLAARACGVGYIIIADLDAARLEVARTLGATHAVQTSKEDSLTQAADKLTAKLGRAPSKAIDCTGAQFAIQLAIEVLQKGGVFTPVGLGPANIEFPMVKIIVKEIELIPSFLYTRTWPAVMEMISSGRCDVAPLVTHRFGLEDAQKAFETAKSGAGIKVMVDCNPE